MWSSPTTDERRRTKRFPIERRVAIRASEPRGAQRTGTGKTLNISSAGVLLTTDLLLTRGNSVELTVDWPVALNGECGVNFLVSGDVVRACKDAVAVRILRYQFRTRSLRRG
jgi:hypothetical protein